VPSLDDGAGSSEPRSGRPSDNGTIQQLATLQVTLTNLLRAVDDDARRMDASLDDAHKLVEDIRTVVKFTIFSSGNPPSHSIDQKVYNSFEQARVAENDFHEIYSEDLECYQKRRRRNLNVADSDSDKLALVKRRRVYISALLAFQIEASVILDLWDIGPSLTLNRKHSPVNGTPM
jgi:hypothetical protein